jgi:hypothetical protein
VRATRPFKPEVKDASATQLRDGYEWFNMDYRKMQVYFSIGMTDKKTY